MLIPVILRIGAANRKDLLQDRIAEYLIHLRRKEIAVIVCKGEAVRSCHHGIARLLGGNLNVRLDDTENGLAEPLKQLGGIVIEEDQVLCAKNGGGQCYRTPDMAPEGRPFAVMLVDPLLFSVPVVRQNEIPEIQFIHPVQHGFQLFRGGTAAMQPGDISVKFIPALKHLADPLQGRQDFISSGEVLPQQTAADNFFSQIVVTGIQLNPAFTGSLAPGVAGFIQLGKDTFITHPDTQCHLRCFVRKAVVLMCESVICPELFQINGFHGYIPPVFVKFHCCQCTTGSGKMKWRKKRLFVQITGNTV